jgi:flagellar motor switch protein FliN/FliY
MSTTPSLGSDSLLDIPVAISVELGRTQLQVKDIMGLNAGTVVELDKSITEPVEIYANGRLIARGEVVVVEDTLGIKITEMVRSR